MKLTITYEGHNETIIDLSEGFTSLAGVNNSGKSTINRALTWVTTGLPRGDSYMPWAGGAADARLEKGPNTVTRYRSASVNKYTVNGVDFKALGTSVPDEVFEALRLDDLNLQKQIKQYYILEESAGTVAKLINEVAGISESDEAIKNVKERLGESNKAKKSLETSIAAETLILQDTEWYQGAEESMADLSMVSAEIDVAEEREKRLVVLKNDIEYSQNLINSFPDYAETAYCLEDIYSEEVGIFELSGIHRQLSDILAGISNIDMTRYEVLEEADLSPIAELDNEVSNLVRTYGDLTSLAYQFRDTDLKKFDVLEEADLSKITEVEYTVASDEQVLVVLKELMTAQANCLQIEGQIIDFQAELAKIKDICPECGQLIGEVHGLDYICR